MKLHRLVYSTAVAALFLASSQVFAVQVLSVEYDGFKDKTLSESTGGCFSKIKVRYDNETKAQKARAFVDSNSDAARVSEITGEHVLCDDDGGLTLLVLYRGIQRAAVEQKALSEGKFLKKKKTEFQRWGWVQNSLVLTLKTFKNILAEQTTSIAADLGEMEAALRMAELKKELGSQIPEYFEEQPKLTGELLFDDTPVTAADVLEEIDMKAEITDNTNRPRKFLAVLASELARFKAMKGQPTFAEFNKLGKGMNDFHHGESLNGYTSLTDGKQYSVSALGLAGAGFKIGSLLEDANTSTQQVKMENWHHLFETFENDAATALKAPNTNEALPENFSWEVSLQKEGKAEKTQYKLPISLPKGLDGQIWRSSDEQALRNVLVISTLSVMRELITQNAIGRDLSAAFSHQTDLLKSASQTDALKEDSNLTNLFESARNLRTLIAKKDKMLDNEMAVWALIEKGYIPAPKRFVLNDLLPEFKLNLAANRNEERPADIGVVYAPSIGKLWIQVRPKNGVDLNVTPIPGAKLSAVYGVDSEVVQLSKKGLASFEAGPLSTSPDAPVAPMIFEYKVAVTQ